MRILIADDKAQVRFALRLVLTKQQEQPHEQYSVIGEASGGQELLAQARLTEPALVLLDWELPGLAEAGGLTALRHSCPALQIIVLSSRTGVRRAALAAGADAFVSKGDSPEHLLTVLRRCAQMAP